MAAKPGGAARRTRGPRGTAGAPGAPAQDGAGAGTLRLFRELAEAGPRIASAPDVEGVLSLGVSFVKSAVGFDRAVALLASEDGAGFRVAALDGYAGDPAARGVASLAVSFDDPALTPLPEGAVVVDQLDGKVGARRLARDLGLDEMVVLPIRGPSEAPAGLLVAGAAPGGTASGTRVRRRSDELLVLESLAAQISTALGHARLREALRIDQSLPDEDGNEGTRKLFEARRATESANAAKSAFLANMSHELRTPLNAIIGYSEMLREDSRGGELDSLAPDLDKINAAGRHLLALINDILDLSRIEAGKMELSLETFDVAEMVREVVEISEPLVRKNRNRLEVACPPSVGALRADLTKVRQSLYNLLSNACKFTEDGLVRLRASRHGEGAGARVTFEVSDTGTGLPPEQASRLFQAFSQADASTTRRYGGTGLGLALSRRLCQLMGGDISVVSEPGRGSCFTIDLPARVGEPRHEGNAEPPPAPHAAPGEAPLVLVIDDDPAVRGLLSASLSRDGCRVAEAESAEEGLALAFQLSPSLVTLDMLMPGMDGWAVLSALKADPETAEIPVVLVTMAEEGDVGFVLGATEFVTKPIDRTRLRQVVARIAGPRGASPALVVDDDVPARRLARRILEEAGWTVLEAGDVERGLEIARATPPGLVLVDLMMKEPDGFELLEGLRRTEAGRAAPVVVVTARDLTAAERKRLSGSVERILRKGRTTRSEVLARVGEALVVQLPA